MEKVSICSVKKNEEGEGGKYLEIKLFLRKDGNGRMKFECKNTAIYNIRSRVHLACDDAPPDPRVVHILIHNFRKFKGFQESGFHRIFSVGRQT